MNIIKTDKYPGINGFLHFGYLRRRFFWAFALKYEYKCPRILNHYSPTSTLCRQETLSLLRHQTSCEDFARLRYNMAAFDSADAVTISIKPASKRSLYLS